MSTHSPVELHIYDEFDNHTGLNFNGDVEYGVPDVQFDIIEGEQFAFLPDGVDYKIVTKATGIGGYDLIIKNQDENDNTVSTYDWILVPLESLESSGELYVGPSYPESNYVLKMDQNGDEVFEQTIEPDEQVDLKVFLNLLRDTISSLGLKPKLKNDLLAKIDKIEKKLVKGKVKKVNKELSKFVKRLELDKGRLKNISQINKEILIDSIKDLLNQIK